MHIWIITKKQLISIAAILAALCLSLFFMSKQDTAVLSQNTSAVPVPILMYHSILEDQQTTNDYVITPDKLEKDMLYLKNQGYTTIFMNDLINHVYEGTPLPDKPVILSFDDGYYNNLLYLLPLLEKYQMKAIVSLVGDFIERSSNSAEKPSANYSYLSWSDVNIMLASGRVEIGNHSYSLHKQNQRIGAEKKFLESDQAYQAMLKADLSKMQQLIQEHTGILPNTFVYPFGRVSKASLDVIRDLGFRASFCCYEKTNLITGDPNGLFLLKRYNRSGSLSTETFMNQLKQ